MSGYMRAKSERLIRVGVEQYRQDDFFRYPPRSLSAREERNLLDAAQQIVDGNGFQADRPLTGIDLNDIILLLYCFHFQTGRIQSTLEQEQWTDVIPASHIMTPFKAVLHSTSSTATERSRKTRREPVFQRIGPDYPAPLQYRPQLILSEVVETGTLGEYRFVLHTGCQAEGTILYRHLLFFYALDEDQPCLVISAEQSSRDPDCLMLCAFHGSRHKNMGSQHRIASVSDFREAAVALARALLSL